MKVFWSLKSASLCRSKLKWVIALLVVACASDASADLITTVPNLPEGTQYRLVFVTSGTRDAISLNINDYNSFVQAQANLSPELAAFNTTWTAIGSTLTIDARDNTSTNPNAAVGVVFYNLNGLKLADNNADFWDGLLFASITWDQFGGFHGSADSVWTGTDHSCRVCQPVRRFSSIPLCTIRTAERSQLGLGQPGVVPH